MQASDRELLELAAKAADIEHGADRLDCGLSITLRNGQHRSLPRWNPLDDDADALRLAVKLSFVVGQHLGAAHAGVPPCPDDYEDGKYPVRIAEMLNAEPYAATRRAIVRAAAEIGRGMK